ncbi:MAG: hypothetical protein WD939_07975 [Dehalococcoidia bacterium]
MEQGAEDAVHEHAKALIARDFGAALRSMTPDALGQAMAVGNTTWIVTGYDVTPEGRDGDDFVFAIAYETDLGRLSLHYRVRDIAGEWKVADITRDGDG